MLVIVGPSASGKTQIVNQLIKTYHMKKMVTYTTRPMRVNEVNGIDYHFITTEDFQNKINQQFFLEYVCYNGFYYGTAKNELTNDKVVIIEKEGLKTYIKQARNLITIVYIQCSKEIRRLRMIARHDEPENISKRLLNDDQIFNQELKKLADLIIDTSNSNIYEDAKIIYQYYQKALL